MSRYIDADDVANAIYHHFPSVRTMADARGIIEEAPSIDIVLCKECRHFDGFYCNRFGEPAEYNSPYSDDGNDFCSFGERKEI